MGTFTNYTDNIPQMSDMIWKANDSFQYQLLSGVFKVANKNLDQVFPHFKDLTVCGINRDDPFDWDESFCGDEDADAILKDLRSPVAFVGTWLILGLIFTIVGIVWCICNKCRCCCRNTKESDLDYLVNADSDSDRRYNLGRDDENDKKKLAWKIVVGVLMGLWILGFSFSVFISFASNEGVRRSIYELYDDLSNSLDDADLYLNTTKRQINGTFITSYGNLSDRIRQQLGHESAHENMFSVLNLSESMRREVEGMKKTEKKGLSISKLIELSHSLTSLQSTVKQVVNPFFAQVAGIGKDWRSDLDNAINITGQDLAASANQIIGALDEVHQDIQEVRDEVETAEVEYLDIVGASIYGTFMSFNLVLLLILIGLVVGSVVIWAGKGSAKKTGFIFYRFSIVLMFTIGWILVIIMVNEFVISGFVINNVCEAVRDLENNETTVTPMPKLPFGKLTFPKSMRQNDVDYEIPKYTYFIGRCKEDHGAYDSFNLRQVYDVNTIHDISNNFRNISGQTSASLSNANSFFRKNANAVYSSLYKELVKVETFKGFVSQTASSSPTLLSLYSKIKFLLVSLLQDIKKTETAVNSEILQTNQTIIALVDEYEEFVFQQVSKEIGRCKPLYTALNATMHTVCYKMVAPVATYWWSLQLLCFLFSFIIGTALISERVFN